MIYQDRADAGQVLATRLMKYARRKDVLVLALPRGGVPVAYEVAQALRVPLDVFVVRKLGLPGQQEFAIGAIATGGVRVLNEEAVRGLNLSQELIEEVASAEREELERRERQYRGNHQRLDVRGKTAILVDDGLATGSTMRAAVTALRQQQPARIVVAVPVGAPEACADFREADAVICTHMPEPFYAVGVWYEDFSQTSDEEVRQLLERAGKGTRRREHVSTGERR